MSGPEEQGNYRFGTHPDIVDSFRKPSVTMAEIEWLSAYSRAMGRRWNQALHAAIRCNDYETISYLAVDARLSAAAGGAVHYRMYGVGKGQADERMLEDMQVQREGGFWSRIPGPWRRKGQRP